jgi:hypothetical protein
VIADSDGVVAKESHEVDDGATVGEVAFGCAVKDVTAVDEDEPAVFGALVSKIGDDAGEGGGAADDRAGQANSEVIPAREEVAVDVIGVKDGDHDLLSSRAAAEEGEAAGEEERRELCDRVASRLRVSRSGRRRR